MDAHRTAQLAAVIAGLALVATAGAAQSSEHVAYAYIGPPRLTEFIQAGKEHAATDARLGKLQFLYCMRPGWHPPPEVAEMRRRARNQRVLAKRFNIHYLNALADGDGGYPAPDYLCSYAESYNCKMLEQVHHKYGKKASELLAAIGLPCD